MKINFLSVMSFFLLAQPLAFAGPISGNKSISTACSTTMVAQDVIIKESGVIVPHPKYYTPTTETSYGGVTGEVHFADQHEVSNIPVDVDRSPSLGSVLVITESGWNPKDANSFNKTILPDVSNPYKQNTSFTSTDSNQFGVRSFIIDLSSHREALKLMKALESSSTLRLRLVQNRYDEYYRGSADGADRYSTCSVYGTYFVVSASNLQLSEDGANFHGMFLY